MYDSLIHCLASVSCKLVHSALYLQITIFTLNPTLHVPSEFLQVLDLNYCFSSLSYPGLKIQYYPVPISHLGYSIVDEQYWLSSARYRVPIIQCWVSSTYVLIQGRISSNGFWFAGKYKVSNIRKWKRWEGEPQYSNFVQLTKNANMVDTSTLLLPRNRHLAVFHIIAIFPILAESINMVNPYILSLP